MIAEIRLDIRPLDTSALLRTATQRFYEQYPDQFDQIVFWASPSLFVPGSFFVPAKVGAVGTGFPATLVDRNLTSSSRLLGIIALGEDWQNAWDKPGTLDQGPKSLLGVLAQETAHAWAAYVRYQLPQGGDSQALLGRDQAHWSFYVNTGGSPLGGNRWQDLGQGYFSAEPVTDIRYSPLDLYLMGILPASEVGHISRIRPSSSSACKVCEGDQTLEKVVISGEKETLTIAQIQAIHGTRTIAAQNTWCLRQAWVFLQTAQDPFNPTILSKLDALRLQWETIFAQATHQKARMTTSLQVSSPTATLCLPLP